MTDKNFNINNSQDEDDAGSGGQAGGVEFRDFISAGETLRDDQLSFDEKKRLISVHKDNHEAKVKKQKELLQRRKDVKEGKMNLADYRQGKGYGQGMHSNLKNHPLSNTAQFGNGSIDNNINFVPDENSAETNNENKQELEYRYNLENKLIQTYTHENRYTPKPSPFK